MTPRRKWLTVQQKYEVLVHHTKHPRLSSEQLAEWAKLEFRLEKPPSRSVVCSILKSADAIEEMARTAPASKRKPTVLCPELETKLVRYIQECRENDIFLSRKLLVEKAVSILETIPDAPALSLSDSWLARFMTRNGFGGNPQMERNENFVPLSEIEPEETEEVQEPVRKKRTPNRNRIIARVYGPASFRTRAEDSEAEEVGEFYADSTGEEASVTSADDHPVQPIVIAAAPATQTMCEPTERLIEDMIAAGAQKEEIGANLCVLRIDGVHSTAWKLYLHWAMSPGVLSPLVQAVFAPTHLIQDSGKCPPDTRGALLQKEANSIIHHMAGLSIRDFLNGIPELPDALETPPRLTNFQDAKVAVVGLLPALSNPGAKYPTINSLSTGQYICNVDYTWRGAVVTVPVFRC